MTLQTTRELTVTHADAGRRLDIFLCEQLDGISRSAVRRWIDSSAVTVNALPRKAGYRLRESDQIRVQPPPPEPLHLVAEDLPLPIVYEDPWLIVVDKPAGMVVHPGAGNRRGTLANALVHHFRDISRSASLRPGIVHRLDKDTSGLMVAARNDTVHEALARQFKGRTVQKRYLALLHGRLAQDRGIIDVPVGRHPRSRLRMSARSHKPREALTEFEVLRRFQEFTLVHAHPRTGRTHQIRVHFLHLGHPVAGDATYGKRAIQRVRDPRAVNVLRRLRRHFLHANFLAFLHPITKEPVSFQSATPAELEEVLDALG